MEETTTVTSDGTDIAFAPELRDPGTYEIVVTSIEAEGCTTTFSTDNSVTLTVNPNPIIDTPADVVLCDGDMLSEIVFTSDVPGTMIIGLTDGDGSSGIPVINLNSIMGTTVSNPGTTASVITVTLTGTSPDGCTAQSTSFMITINPTPTVTDIDDLSLCNGDMGSVTFGGPVDGTTFTWMSDVDFGAGTSSDGNATGIDFIGVNTGTTDLVATVTVTPTASNCEGPAETFTVTVRPTPTVDQVADVAVCSGGEVAEITFTGAVAGATYTYTSSNADFGIPTMGTGMIDAFTALENTSGVDVTTTITVVATIPSGGDDNAPEECESMEMTFAITIQPKPVAVATPVSQTVCSDEEFSIAFTEDSGIAGITTYEWTVTDETLPVGVTVSEMSGTTDISVATINNVSGSAVTVNYEVIPTGENGCVGNAVPFNVMVDPEPVTEVTVNTPEVCSEEPIDVTFAETSGIAATTTFDWMITTDLTGNADSVFASAMSGSGDISTLMITNISSAPVTVDFSVAGTAGECLGDTETFSVTVNPKPIGVDSTVTGCSVIDVDIDLQGLIENNVSSSFSWYLLETSSDIFVGENSMATEANPSTDPMMQFQVVNNSTQPQTATYIVFPTGTDGQCAGESFEVTIALFGDVGAFFSTPDGTTVCNGSSIDLQGTPIGGQAPFTYDFTIVNAMDGADGTFTDLGNGTFSFMATSTGSLNVQLIITDDNDCASDPFVLQTPITIIDAPEQPTLTGPTEVCPGATEMYSVINPQPGVTYIFNNFQGGTLVPTGPSSATIIFANIEGGPLPLTVMASAGGCSVASEALNINLVDVEAAFTFANDPADPNGLTYNFTDVSDQANTFAWDFAGLDTSTDQNPTFTFPGSGDYEVCLTVDGDCGMDESCQIVTVTFVPTADCDEIPLAAGFNIISTDVAPADSSISAVFSELIADGELTFVQGRNDMGQVVVWSPFLPSNLNTLQVIERGKGYIVSVNTATELIVCGDMIDPAFRRSLNAGINIVAYLPQAPSTPNDFFSDLFPGNLTLARGYENGSYQTFNPFLPPSINTLTEVVNGRGYEINLSNTVSEGDWLVSIPTDDPDAVTRATNQYMVVAASTNLSEEYVGEFAYVTNLEGDVYARMEVVDGGYLMTTPLYDNELAVSLEEDVELYVKFRDVMVPLGERFSADSRLVINDLDFSALTSTETESTLDYDLTLAPNPFQGEMTVTLTLGQSGTVSARVVDVAGREVVEVLNGEMLPAGTSTLYVDGMKLPAGTYMLVVSVNDTPLFQERIIRIK